MDWKEIGQTVANSAPILGGLLGGPAGAVAGKLVAGIFGTDPEPEKVSAAIQNDPQAFLKLKQYEMQHKENLQRMEIEAEVKAIAETNATIRAEVASPDEYVRRMRPTFGYILCGTIAIEALLAVYVAAFQPSRLADLAVVFDALATPQAVALAALGVYFKMRSNEKMANSPNAPGQGLLAGLFGGGK